MKKVTKEEYISPKIESFYVELEQGIAANSAVVTPPASGGIPTEWEGEEDVEIDVPW